MPNLSAYRKAIVAALGLASIVAAQAFGINEGWVEPLIAALTAAGVFGVANASAAE